MGDVLLKTAEASLARCIAYPSEAARVAYTLWIAHAHRLDAWDSTPRIAFLSPEPGSGRSRALDAVNTSSAYVPRWRLLAWTIRPTPL
jgi:hypothetical protein